MPHYTPHRHAPYRCLCFRIVWLHCWCLSPCLTCLPRTFLVDGDAWPAWAACRTRHVPYASAAIMASVSSWTSPYIKRILDVSPETACLLPLCLCHPCVYSHVPSACHLPLYLPVSVGTIPQTREGRGMPQPPFLMSYHVFTSHSVTSYPFTTLNKLSFKTHLPPSPGHLILFF